MLNSAVKQTPIRISCYEIVFNLFSNADNSQGQPLVRSDTACHTCEHFKHNYPGIAIIIRFYISQFVFSVASRRNVTCFFQHAMVTSSNKTYRNINVPRFNIKTYIFQTIRFALWRIFKSDFFETAIQSESSDNDVD